MKKSVVSMLVVGIVSVIILVACNRNGNDQNDNEFPEVIELIEGGDYFHAGDLTPITVDVVDNVANISFFETPANFTIHVADRRSQQCVDLFKHAIHENKALKIFALKNSLEITQVNQIEGENLSIIKLDDYLKMASRAKSTYNFPTKYIYEFLVDKCRRCCNWDYTGEGCYARAHEVYRVFKDKGYDTFKIFIYGKIAAKNYRKNCGAKWNWHVATVVNYYETDSLIHVRVFDFSASKEPMQVNEWISACTDKSVWSEAGLSISAKQQPGEIYKYDPYRNRIMLDESFENTDCVNAAYENLSGCWFHDHNCGDHDWLKEPHL